MQVILKERWVILSWSEGYGGKEGGGGVEGRDLSWENELGCSQIMVERVCPAGCFLEVI